MNKMKSVRERWEKPAMRVGTITILLCIVATLFPSIYLNIRYDAWIGWPTFWNTLSVMFIYFGINWFIEPLSFYPVLGTAGSYLAWLAGSCAQQRVPAALTAKSIAKVEDGTQEAEVVGVAAIAGSIVINLIVLTATCFIGTWLLSILPEVITEAMSSYIVPALMGAMLAMMGASAPMLTIPVCITMIVLNVLVTNGILTIPSWTLPLIAIVGTCCLARISYVRKVKAATKEE